VWYGQWRDEQGSKRTRIFGECSQMSESRAWLELAEILKPINEGVCRPSRPVYSFGRFVGEIYLPHARKRWKEDSTARTSEEIINGHLVEAFGSELLHKIRREDMQNFLDSKAGEYSYSMMAHMRWFLKAIYDLAMSDGIVNNNPAAKLVVNKGRCKAGRDVRPLTKDEVVSYLTVLDLRERLIARLAIFEGLRPGEILALRWRHIGVVAALVEQRLYRGSFGSPKNGKAREVGLSSGTIDDLTTWRGLALDRGPNGFVFPSETLRTPLSRDNLWRRHMKHRLETIELDWATFQVLRSTNASLGEKACVSTKVSADQRGHRIGVSLDVYTKSDLEQKREVVNQIEDLVFGKRRLAPVSEPEAA